MRRTLWYVFSLELVLCGYMFTTNYSFAIPAKPNCNNCSCKMTFAWMDDGAATANGSQTQDNPPAKVLDAVAPLQAVNCPDPPNIANDGTKKYDRYSYQNPTQTCKSINVFVIEADVAGAGTRVDIGRQAEKCVP